MARRVGHLAAALTAALALDRIANGVSRIFWGWVSDHIGRETDHGDRLHAAGRVPAERDVGRALVGHAVHRDADPDLLHVGRSVFALPVTRRRLLRRRHATSNYSFLYSAKGVASIIGGGLAAMLFEKFGSWSAAFYGSALMALISSGLAVMLKRMPLPRKVAAGEKAVYAGG